MASSWHLSKLSDGRPSWNAWRRQHPDLRPDLQSACFEDLRPPLRSLRAFDLHHADCTAARFALMDLRGANLSEASLERAALEGACLDEANLTRAFLNGACLDGASALHADFEEANLSGATLIQGRLHQASFRAAFLIHADLHDAEAEACNFSEAILRHACLTGGRFLNSHFARTNLIAADLSHAVLRGANLSHADLRSANLSHADLRGTDLNGADLRGTLLLYTDLSGAQLDGAVCRDTVFGNTNLSGATGLEAIKHVGPSTLDRQTTMRPGTLLWPFLLGCGLQDWEIDARAMYEPGLTQPRLAALLNRLENAHPADPTPAPSCFILHTEQDTAFADRLASDLQRSGTRCWTVSEHEATLFSADLPHLQRVTRTDRYFFLISRHALYNPWLRREANRLMGLEQIENRAICFFLQLDDALQRPATPWARRIKHHRALRPFFLRHDPMTYRMAFGELLFDLEAPRFVLP